MKTDKTKEAISATGLKAKTSATDGTCATVPAGKCRDANGLPIALGKRAWTSLTNALCTSADVPKTSCRISATHIETLFSASGYDKKGQKSSTDAECTDTNTTTDCRNPDTGVNEALGIKAWTSATD